MSNSSLVSYTKLSPNKNVRNAPITKITIHHMAIVNGSLEGVGNHFAKSSAQASSNYGIDSEGRIALYVEEQYRAWTSSNAANDHAAITIEVANSKGAPNWEVSDKAYEALINLCVDICKRNNIKELVYTGDKTGNLTRHNMFANTTCPGPYLQSRFDDIANRVNKELGKTTTTTNNNKAQEVNTVNIEMNVLSRGMTGPQVKTLQRLLNALGYNCGNVDGSFGPKTDTAVRNFQKARGLAVDGIVGKQTWPSLLK